MINLFNVIGLVSTTSTTSISNNNCDDPIMKYMYDKLKCTNRSPRYVLQIQIQIQNNFIVPYTYMYIGVFFYNKVNNSYYKHRQYTYIYMYIFTLKRDW